MKLYRTTTTPEPKPPQPLAVTVATLIDLLMQAVTQAHTQSRRIFALEICLTNPNADFSPMSFEETAEARQLNRDLLDAVINLRDAHAPALTQVAAEHHIAQMAKRASLN